jgi:hypothetical protein
MLIWVLVPTSINATSQRSPCFISSYRAIIPHLMNTWSAEISQHSDAPGPDGIVNLFLYLVE